MNTEILFNGVKVAQPVLDSFNQLEQVVFQEEGTGRNQKGDMVLTVIGRAKQIDLEWRHISKNEMRKIINELRKVVVEVSMYDPFTGKNTKRNFYCSEIPMKVADFEDSETYSFNVSLISMEVI